MRSNPFDSHTDPDRHAIWQMLIADDSEAFVARDFSRVEGDFDVVNFEGIRCGMSGNPANWSLTFPTLADYRANWLEGAIKFTDLRFKDLTALEAIYSRCSLNRIDI